MFPDSEIPKSIKGRNSVVNLRKTKFYITNVDLVNDNVYTKFILNRSIRFQDIEKKLLTSIKGCNSVANLPKFELIQAFMHFLVTCKNKEDPIKMKALECSQDFSNYTSMGIFPHAQGKLTPQSMVGSGRISNSSAILWLSWLPAKMKKIRSKMKALGWPQDNMLIFLALKGR